MFVAPPSMFRALTAVLLLGSTVWTHAQTSEFLGSGVSVPVSNMHTRSLGWMKAGRQEGKEGQFWYTATPTKSGAHGLQPERWQISTGFAWKSGHTIGLSTIKEPMPNLRSQVQLIYQSAPIGPGQFVLGLGPRKSSHSSATKAGTGLTAGYDWGGVSLRMNYDPWVSETSPNAWRFSVSTQF